jgi:chromate transporter
VSSLAILASLAAVFMQLSLLAFGGANSVLPEMQRQVVEVHGWLTAHEFAALFALAQAAPGPNMLVVTLIGWRVAALPGALVATIGVAAPSSVLTFVLVRLWYRFRDAPWRRLMQAGLTPVTAGLIMASAALLIRTTTIGWGTAAITAVATVLFLATRLHPLLVLAGAAALGASGVLG